MRTTTMKLVKLAAENPRTLGRAVNLFGEAIRLVYPSYKLGLSRKAWELSQEANKLSQKASDNNRLAESKKNVWVREIVALQSGIITARIPDGKWTTEEVAKQLRFICSRAETRGADSVRVIKLHQICNVGVSGEEVHQDITAEEEKKGMDDLADYLRRFNIEFTPVGESVIEFTPFEGVENISQLTEQQLTKHIRRLSAVSPWHTSAIKCLLELLSADVSGAPIFKSINFHHDHSPNLLDDLAYVNDRGLFFNPIIFGRLDRFSFFVVLAHEFGHGIEHYYKGAKLEKQDIWALRDLFDMVIKFDAVVKKRVEHIGFIPDFFTLYLLAGEQLRSFIAERTTQQNDGLQAFYAEFKEKIFAGKEFADAVPSHFQKI